MPSSATRSTSPSPPSPCRPSPAEISPFQYTLTPDLPPGLTFNSGSRVLSGTPTATAGDTDYTYRVTDGNFATRTQVFTLGVFARPTLTKPADQAYTVGQMVDFTLPAAGGGAAPLTYTLTRPDSEELVLATGLIFEPVEHTIRGEPQVGFATETAANLVYTITDANSLFAAATFTLQVAEAPSFSEKTRALTTSFTPSASPSRR